jgi:hypothetical protein
MTPLRIPAPRLRAVLRDQITTSEPADLARAMVRAHAEDARDYAADEALSVRARGVGR